MIPVPLLAFGLSILTSVLADGTESDEFGGTAPRKPKHRTLAAPSSGLVGQQQTQGQTSSGQPYQQDDQDQKSAEEAMDEVMRKIDAEFMTDRVGDEVADSLFEDAFDR